MKLTRSYRSPHGESQSDLDNYWNSLYASQLPPGCGPGGRDGLAWPRRDAPCRGPRSVHPPGSGTIRENRNLAGRGYRGQGHREIGCPGTCRHLREVPLRASIEMLTRRGRVGTGDGAPSEVTAPRHVGLQVLGSHGRFYAASETAPKLPVVPSAVSVCPRPAARTVHLGVSIDSMTARGFLMARPNRRTGMEPAEIIR